ncbi:MAG TPA: response regulator transcription factor, partial [Vicinamibacterales bacterium]|nr:response regulator transcription factor [Vicinamibacterales bacterium]
MRALIVDDEPAALRRLSTLLDELGVVVVGEAADGIVALRLVHEKRPDVVFLDISMPEVDGFDVARRLAEPRPLVIFQTAYGEYALEAFDHEAVDYVLKPVTRERLVLALDRAQRRLTGHDRPFDTTALHRLGAAIGHVPGRPARLLVRHAGGHRLVPVEQISRFRADQGLVHAQLDGSAPGTDYSLNELESRLEGVFVRVSRSELVAIAAIESIR